MSADEYTPTTEHVRQIFQIDPNRNVTQREQGKAFDRWLAARDAEIRKDERELVAQDLEAVDFVEWMLAGQYAGADAADIARGVRRAT